MSTPRAPPACEGMYSKLIEDQGQYDGFSHRPDVGHSAHPVSVVRLIPRPGAPGFYRLATFGLTALCIVLLVSTIALSARAKNKPQSDAEETPELQRLRQDKNISALVDSISRLQQEKKQLQKEKEDLQASLDARPTCRVPEVTKPTRPSIVCPPDWELFNSSCYLISRNRRDWPESKSFCESQGAYLAIIHTAEEQTFLWDRLPRGHWNAYWFGITDGHTEDVWKWVDDTPLVGGFWEVGEPNNHINEDCGYIVKTEVLERVATSSWYDAPCGMYLPFICEKDMGPGASTAIPH